MNVHHEHTLLHCALLCLAEWRAAHMAFSNVFIVLYLHSPLDGLCRVVSGRAAVSGNVVLGRNGGRRGHQGWSVRGPGKRMNTKMSAL
jgi:hypothetical protein